jgi:hypothetical protein
MAVVAIELVTPSVLEVAELLRARTKDSNGVEVGTFNDATRPTSAQVAGMAQTAAHDIQLRLGTSPPPEVTADAKGCAALLAACMVELSFFPEQVRTEQSPYNQLRELLTFRLRVLTSWVGGGEDGGQLLPGALEVRSLRIPVLNEEYVDANGVVQPIVPAPV